MKVEAELIKMYKIELQNSCYSMGYYYSEDDYHIGALAPTLNELVEKLAINLLDDDRFYMKSGTLEEGNVLKYEGATFEYNLKEVTTIEDKSYYDIYIMATECDTYKVGRKKQKAEKEAKEKAKKKKEEKAKLAQRKQQYETLKNEFEN